MCLDFCGGSTNAMHSPGSSKRSTSESSNPSFSFSKDETDNKVGQALISKAVTSKQLDSIKQYDDDSSAVGSSLEAMDSALDDLSNDVKELGRCLKSSAFATAQLQKVQERINGQIKDMLRREKAKMEVKEKSILTLDRKLRKIEKNQAKILFGYKAYKYLRIAVIILFVWAIIGTVFSVPSISGAGDEDGGRRRRARTLHVGIVDATKKEIGSVDGVLPRQKGVRFLDALSSVKQQSKAADRTDSRPQCDCL